MGELDSKTKGRLMLGYPLEIDEKLNLPPKTIGEILFIGEEEYSKMIGLLSIDKSMLVKNEQDIEKYKDLTTFDILVGNCYYSIEARKEVLSYLQFFFNDNVGFLEKYMCFYIGDLEDDVLLDENNYEKFLDCMKIQNKVDNSKAKKKPKKMSKKQQEIEAKLKKGKKMLEKARGQDEVKLSDLFLNLVVFFNGDFETCKNLTLYQFYETYQKVSRREKFNQNFDIFIAGGDAKKLDLDNHWTAKEVKKIQERPQSI